MIYENIMSKKSESRIERCAACGSVIHVYKYTLGDSTISLLRKLWLEVVETKQNDVDVRRVDLSYTERSRLTICRFHALIAKVRDQNKKHISAHWRLTARGGAFLRGEISIPKHVFVYQNHVRGHGEELIHIRQFRMLDDFGPTWEYASRFEIIDGNPIPQPIAQDRLPLGLSDARPCPSPLVASTRQ